MRCAVCGCVLYVDPVSAVLEEDRCECDRPDPAIPWSKVKEIHKEGKIVGRLKIMHRLAVLLREYAGGAK